jgi:replicative DNA helicase
VGGLSVGDFLATTRANGAPDSATAWSDEHVIMLAHLLGDGCVSRSPVYYCSRDEACLRAVEEAADAFGVNTTRTPGRGVTYVHFPMRGNATHGVTSPLYDWLRDLELYGKRAPEKRAPSAVHCFDDRRVKLFLRHLWATDGSVTVSRKGKVRVFYATTSRALADDVQALLLRLGIGGRLRRAASKTEFPIWSVDVSGRDDLLTFLTEVGVHGERGERCREALDALRDSRSNPNVDIVPPAAWDYVRKAMREGGVTTRRLAELLEMSYCGSALYKAGLSRARMARVAAAVSEPFLHDLATSDVRWDRITAIDPAGDEEVFDAHVPGTHSFLANDVVSHNSGAIEQDADVVILLHREDVYERESPRAGEADLIVAKHRNGPTDTLVVAFQGHYSRFVDMAPG